MTLANSIGAKLTERQPIGSVILSGDQAPIVLAARQVTKSYPLDEAIVSALRGVDVFVREREFVALVGASGSGKSTLLSILGGLEAPTSGTVAVCGLALNGLNRNRLAELRAERMGFVFQTFNLLPVLTVFENVEYPLHLRGMDGRRRQERVRALLQDVGLSAFERHKPAQLSGGQRQRVAIARALVGNPSIVLADEPTANLDHQTGMEILELMRTLNRTKATTFLLATHDAKMMAVADRVIRLADGRICPEL